MDRIIMIGRTYRHFKGNLYKVLFIATDSETNEEVVVYEALYGNHIIWTRPYNMFNSLVDKDKYPLVRETYRFELID